MAFGFGRDEETMATIVEPSGTSGSFSRLSMSRATLPAARTVRANSLWDKMAMAASCNRTDLSLERIGGLEPIGNAPPGAIR
jgi:hypothetical protein